MITNFNTYDKLIATGDNFLILWYINLTYILVLSMNIAELIEVSYFTGNLICLNRQKGLEKAKAMAVHIAYPDELLDDSKLEGFYEKVHDLMN
jgi:hypothetical protein